MDVSDWRKRIDEVDRQILALLNERLSYVLELAPLKRQRDIPVHEPKREEEVFANVRAQNRGPLSHEAVRRIFESIVGEMRAAQERYEHRGEDRSKTPGKRASTVTRAGDPE